MGGMNLNLDKKEKQYENLYPLDSKEGILLLLEDLHHVRENRFYSGDFDACNLLMDLDISIKNARLTKKQAEVLRLLYEMDLTQESASKLIGISQQGVVDRRNNAIERVAKYNLKVGLENGL